MSWNNALPAWALGNPYGPVPSDGKYYYENPRTHHRVGPFDTLEEARLALIADHGKCYVRLPEENK